MTDREIIWPAWAEKFPTWQRRFCERCGAVVIHGHWVHNLEAAYEPSPGGRYKIAGMEMTIHHCPQGGGVPPTFVASVEQSIMRRRRVSTAVEIVAGFVCLPAIRFAPLLVAGFATGVFVLAILWSERR